MKSEFESKSNQNNSQNNGSHSFHRNNNQEHRTQEARNSGEQREQREPREAREPREPRNNHEQSNYRGNNQYRNQYRDNSRHSYSNQSVALSSKPAYRNKPDETAEDIKIDITRIEKEIQLEIKEIKSMRLGL